MESAVTADSAHWPHQLAQWIAEVREVAAHSPAAPSPARERAWLLLHDVLRRFLRLHAHKLGRFDEDDLDDLAAEKSLDLLLRAERGEWSVEGRRPGEVVNYLSTVARNGLIDRRKEQARFVDAELGGGEGQIELAAPAAMGADLVVEGREFATHLRACCDELPARSRTVWFLRVFLDLASRDIADHPRVQLRRGNVDVILQRTRAAIRLCMEKKGHVVQDPPLGAFVAVWRSMRDLEET